MQTNKTKPALDMPKKRDLRTLTGRMDEDLWVQFEVEPHVM